MTDKLEAKVIGVDMVVNRADYADEQKRNDMFSQMAQTLWFLVLSQARMEDANWTSPDELRLTLKVGLHIHDEGALHDTSQRLNAVRREIETAVAVVEALDVVKH